MWIARNYDTYETPRNPKYPPYPLNPPLDQFDSGLKLYISTRQPHLLRAFQQEFGVWVDFNNERVVAECDVVFMCVLPFQAQ